MLCAVNMQLGALTVSWSISLSQFVPAPPYATSLSGNYRLRVDGTKTVYMDPHLPAGLPPDSIPHQWHWKDAHPKRTKERAPRFCVENS